MSKPFCMNLWLVIPEKVRYNRKKDISKPVISGEFRCVSAEKKAGHAPGGNLRMTGFDCTKKKWGFLRMSTESKTRMTEGSISKKMILFAIPLFLGNLFQQLYNTADSLIVGNFLGSNALAAVSSSGNLIFLMVGFINGIAMGAGVVIARYYGAKNREDLQKAIHTTVAFGLAAGAALTVLGMYLAPKILVPRTCHSSQWSDSQQTSVCMSKYPRRSIYRLYQLSYSRGDERIWYSSGLLCHRELYG